MTPALLVVRLALLVLGVSLAAYVSAGEGPDVVVRFAADAPSEFRTYVTRGAGEWHELGFDVVDASSAPPCPVTWVADGVVDCAITVDVERQELEPGVAALSASRSVTFSVRLDASTYAGKLELWAVAAHELGHVLLGVGHLADGVAGVMASPPTTHDPTEADFELACAEGLCR